VSYDAKRGEPRGARKKDIDPLASGLGDCIDCRICVQVCPTGIDIRDGLQYQCINCALCIDGCDSVMDKMGYARGLIRYTTENVLEGKPYRWLRPRLIGYAAGVLIMTMLFGYTVAARIPLHLDVVRERGQLYRQTSDGLIENVYTLKILNIDENPHRFTIDVRGLPDVQIIGPRNVDLDSGEARDVPLRLAIDPALLKAANDKIEFHIGAADNATLHAHSESRFLAPRTH
jgi:cytochrome c oxidase accessory protein FixG